MSLQANKDLVTRTWDAVTKGDIETFMNNLADDVTWTFFGSHRFAGTFRGKEDLTNKLFAPLGEILEDGIKVEIDSLTAEADRVVMEARGQAMSKTGKPYNNSYCVVITIADNRIQQVREYLDSELVSEVFGKP